MPNWRIYKVFLFTKPGWNGLGPLNVLIVQEGWQIAKTASYTVTWVSKYFRARMNPPPSRHGTTSCAPLNKSLHIKLY